jgi:membrane protein implicated in regulation of membrane protease activity
VELWIQAVVFIAVSAVSLTLFFTVFKKRIPKKEAIPTNVDALIGAKGIVEEKIDNIRETGSVKLRGLIWSARSADEAVVIEAGSIVTVKEIVGVKLICQIDGAD